MSDTTRKTLRFALSVLLVDILLEAITFEMPLSHDMTIWMRKIMWQLAEVMAVCVCAWVGSYFAFLLFPRNAIIKPRQFYWMAIAFVLITYFALSWIANPSLISLSGYVMAADSVVTGSALQNYFFSKPACPQDAGSMTLCLDANYIWVLESRKTISGPKIVGKIRAVSVQHVGSNPDFVKAVELFVLRPIEDPAIRRNSHAAYYLLALSPRDNSGYYCFSDDPAVFGLKLAQEDVIRDEWGRFCFADAALIHAGV